MKFLLYHGVTKIKQKGIENASGKHIFIRTFINQMRFLKKCCQVLSINEIVELKINRKRYPPRAVVISFDDGFRNNYANAAPILYDLKLPAVFYITSGMIGRENLFWVDEIEDCINLTSQGTVMLTLERKHEFLLQKKSEKLFAVKFIKAYVKNHFDRKEVVLRDLKKETKVNPDVSHAKNYEILNWKELMQMAQCPLFTIGGHSLNHDILSQLERKEMKKNIDRSIDILRERLNLPIRHYSYPEGQSLHFDENVISHLKKRGIVCCPTAILGLNTQKTDLFHLKRIMVGFESIRFPFASATTRLL